MQELHDSNLRTPQGEEDCQEHGDKLVGDGHNSLTVDFIRLAAVNPLPKRDAAEPEQKKSYETKKDSHNNDHSLPPYDWDLLLNCVSGLIDTTSA